MLNARAGPLAHSTPHPSVRSRALTDRTVGVRTLDFADGNLPPFLAGGGKASGSAAARP
ncbi:hypothetical protein [Wenjunlia tyrosinilytica]|uniref:Uncharacterized protein n=1 Tax=Wenjunlia tyrosinilytica TaxID=1544741 RepID=A0A918E192_9ACTN|nr:hypothetical protein [Wenjunlia tyrosinilytica]GGO95405.1 hypothetical protein GCM10012280_52520 [Wenjunlia tyrosinilytica]